MPDPPRAGAVVVGVVVVVVADSRTRTWVALEASVGAMVGEVAGVTAPVSGVGATVVEVEDGGSEVELVIGWLVGGC
jgi:hypothetical protein